MYYLQADSDIEEEMARMESADEDEEDERPLAEVGFRVSSSVDSYHTLVTGQVMLPSAERFWNLVHSILSCVHHGQMSALHY